MGTGISDIGGNLFSRILLHPEDLLLSSLPDFYKRGSSGFTASVARDRSYEVGRVEKLGSGISSSLLGKIVFFISGGDHSVDFGGSDIYAVVNLKNVILFYDDSDGD